MIKANINIDNLRLVAAGLIVGFVVALPMSVAQALDDTTEKPVVQQEEVTESPSPSPEVTESPEPTTTPEPEVTTPPEVTEPEEEEVVVEKTPVASLQVAITIAVEAHPDVDVIAAKIKTLGAETVYKVTFADGWRIYISADDGELLIVKDGEGKLQRAYNRAKVAWMHSNGNWNPFSTKYKAHCKEYVEQNGLDDVIVESEETNSTESTTVSTQQSTESSSEYKKNKSHRSSHRSSWNR